MPAFVSIQNRAKNGCPHSSASEIGRKTDARVRQHPKSDEKRMLAFVSIRNRTENGCPRLPASKNRPPKGCSRMPASEIGRKMDARVRQHPKIGLRKDARVCWHPFGGLFISGYKSADTSGNLFPLPSDHSGKRIKGSDG